MTVTEDLYRFFLRRLLRNYIVGSLIAVLGVGGVLMFTTLHFRGAQLSVILATLGVSLLCMFAVESIAFRRDLRPIREVLFSQPENLQILRTAYARAHRFPLLTVRRVLGPHLFGLAIPEVILTIWEIHARLLQLPDAIVLTALLAAVLVASMHGMVEYFLATTAIQPVLTALRQMAKERFDSDLSLDGQVVVSIRTKFLLSTLFVGTLPLLLFSLATQWRLTEIAGALSGTYWQWAIGVLLIGICFATIGAWLLWVSVRHPIEQLQSAMRSVQRGDLAVRANDLYSDEFSRLVAGFNHMVGGLLARDELNTLLLDSYFATLAAALDARDPYTAGHSVRVAQYAVEIGRKVGLPTPELQNLRKCSLLHDIGKIGVRDSILLKEGRLTEDEFDQMKKHPALGEAILREVQPVEAMAPLLPGVRSHHERYDGKGYPDGAAGDDIPLFGRIIAVADAFDAMTSDRPYRKGMPVAKALSILDEGRGSQWDPLFADGFIEWARQNPHLLDRPGNANLAEQLVSS
ncbi:MAG: HD domain-containing protein [Firmicutes bacterium]|nr:HD domain-containing protein [Bacillota bacterium]